MKSHYGIPGLPYDDYTMKYYLEFVKTIPDEDNYEIYGFNSNI
jgi:hypothetical protein